MSPEVVHINIAFALSVTLMDVIRVPVSGKALKKLFGDNSEAKEKLNCR
jgi:hypothetical protein